MRNHLYLPFYLKISQVCLGIVAFFFILYAGQRIILPFIFAVVLAILLNPFVNLLHRKKINRVIAIFLVLVGTMILAGGFIFFILSQLTMFFETLPLWQEKFDQSYAELVSWISQTFNIHPSRIYEWVNLRTSEGMDNTTIVIGNTITTVAHVMLSVVLVPVYIFFLLFYKSLLLTFISKLFSNNAHSTVVDVLHEIKFLIQNYLVGLLIEAAIVATLNSLTLIIIGIDYPILLGIIYALLNIIPYLGGLIAVTLIMTFAFVTESPLSAVLVLMAYLLVHFIDVSYILPKIVGSKVKINALVSIIAVLIGGELFGIPGMFLAIPLTAIVKVIFDRIEPFKPVGFLLGDTMPPIGKNIFNIGRLTNKLP